MKILVWACAILWCSLGNANASTDPSDLKIGSISGKVVDNTLQQPVPFAAIVLKSIEDERTISGGITAEDGTFELKKLEEGTYILEVQFIGYKTYSQQVSISKANRKLDLGTIATHTGTSESLHRTSPLSTAMPRSCCR